MVTRLTTALASHEDPPITMERAETTVLAFTSQTREPMLRSRVMEALAVAETARTAGAVGAIAIVAAARKVGRLQGAVYAPMLELPVILAAAESLDSLPAHPRAKGSSNLIGYEVETASLTGDEVARLYRRCAGWLDGGACG